MFLFQLLKDIVICVEPTLTWGRPTGRTPTNTSMPEGTTTLPGEDQEGDGLLRSSGEDTLLLVALTTTWLADRCTSLQSLDADWMKFTSCCLIFSFSVVAESWRTDWGVAVQPTLLLIRKQTAGAEMEATPTATGQGGFLQNTSLKPSSDQIIYSVNMGDLNGTYC